MVLPLRGQEGRLLADPFDRSWNRHALEKPPVAQAQPAPQVEPSRKGFQAAQPGSTFWTEPGRGIQVEPFAPSQSNRRAALDSLAAWSRSRRRSGPSRCTIPIRICSHWRIAHERHRRRDIAQHSPVGSTSGASALFGGSRSIEPFLSRTETLEAGGGCRRIDVLPFRVEARRAQPVDMIEKLVDKSRHATITR